MEKHSSQVVRTVDVIGKKVVDPELKTLGEIEEIVLDKKSGETRYAVLSFGGFLGLGDKLYAIPWKSINYLPEEDSFVLHVAKEQLKSAPGFAKDNWPDFANTTFIQSVSDFYQ